MCVTLGQLQTSFFVLLVFWVGNYSTNVHVDHVCVLYICLRNCTCRRVAFSGLLLITLYAAFDRAVLCVSAVLLRRSASSVGALLLCI